MKFHVGTVLSITMGKLLSTDGMDGVYKILDLMTGTSLFTHQLPRAADCCAPELLRQHPRLSEVNVTEVNEANCDEVMCRQVAIFGEELEVLPLPPGVYEYKNPVTELRELAPQAKVFVVQVTKE